MNINIKWNALFLCLSLCFFLSLNAAADIISLRAVANNMYVCAENGGASPLIANRSTAQGWEQFDGFTTVTVRSACVLPQTECMSARKTPAPGLVGRIQRVRQG